MGSPVRDVGGDRRSRPKQSHVAPSTAFPPVKRTRKGKTPAPVSSTQPPTTAAPTAVASPPVHIDLPEPPAPVAAPSPVTQGIAVTTFASLVPGLEGVLADTWKSLASLAPAAQSGAPPGPLTGVALPATVPAALPVPLPTPKAPEHQTQVQDPSRQTLLEVSRLLASISTPPVNSPPPTTPWGADDSLQNTLNELKRQVDALSAAHTSNPQASVHSPSVTLWGIPATNVAPVNHCKNLISASQNSCVVARKLAKEQALGRLAGPFERPPLSGFVCSPLGVVPKREPGQFRLIHNLSAPRGSSVNDAIDRQLCSVRYASADNAVEKVRALGQGALLAKTDIESAFYPTRRLSSLGFSVPWGILL
ncbi:hypothetical protein NDU88_006401 [Pleurodeles waltl]|uniref:Uncharacterized protein n=1 Tax=Pleurodeles waltl TaxID=8319 RepID=A0AAV7X421_PLEWA|nr:hypothetical protein NDU88_006401 [Pleurodeles waltl]